MYGDKLLLSSETNVVKKHNGKKLKKMKNKRKNN
jgi:hypothetical protein